MQKLELDPDGLTHIPAAKHAKRLDPPASHLDPGQRGADDGGWRGSKKSGYELFHAGRSG
jgi:hypothetical protein